MYNIEDIKNTVVRGNCLEVLKKLPGSVIDCIVTSPPYYGLRSYNTEPQIWSDGWKGELGQEKTFRSYIYHLVEIFLECKRVLKNSGSMWINISDTYSTGSGGGTHSKNSVLLNTKQSKAQENKKERELNFARKTLLGIPFRLATRLIDEGLILRNVISWHKESCVPESVKDRFTRDSEYLFFFVKNEKYFFRQQFETLKQISIERSKYNWCKTDKKASLHQDLNGLNRKDYAKLNPLGRNMRTTWTINPKGFHGKHYAGFPKKLIETPIRATTPIGGIVLDPFFGSGTSGIVAYENYANFIGIELNKEYIEISKQRFKDEKIPKEIFGKNLPKDYLLEGIKYEFLKNLKNELKKIEFKL